MPASLASWTYLIPIAVVIAVGIMVYRVKTKGPAIDGERDGANGDW